jgi:hypothetical protein
VKVERGGACPGRWRSEQRRRKKRRMRKKRRRRVTKENDMRRRKKRGGEKKKVKKKENLAERKKRRKYRGTCRERCRPVRTQTGTTAACQSCCPAGEGHPGQGKEEEEKALPHHEVEG